MATGPPIVARDRERVAALAAGLAAMLAVWTFAVAFVPDELESLGRYSAWVYGSAATAGWACFSIIAYVLISHGQRRAPPVNALEGYRCRELALKVISEGCSVCADQREKNRLGAATAGFALTMSGWVTALSFMPDNWLDWFAAAPAWLYYAASVAAWIALSGAMYFVLRASHTRFD